MAASMAGQVGKAVRPWRTDSMQASADPADVESVTFRYPMYVPLPAWFLPGIADYVVHRHTRIERTSGLATVASLIAVPYAEEPWRCARARKL